MPPAVRRGRMLQALVDQLLDAARHSPVLVFVEDADWIDPTTLALLQDCRGNGRDTRVLVVTTRPEGVPAMDAASHLTRLALARLGRVPARALMARSWRRERYRNDEARDPLAARTACRFSSRS